MREDFLRPPASPAGWAADGIRLLGLISVLAAFVWWTPTDAGILALALPALLVPRLLGVLPWFDVLYGVTVSVAAKRVIASSHVTGRARNAIGGMSHVSAAQ